MIGKLRRGHFHRYELPLRGRPVELVPQRRPDGPLRPGPAARRRMPHRVDDAELHHWRSRAGGGVAGRRSRRSSGAAQERARLRPPRPRWRGRGGSHHREPGHRDPAASSGLRGHPIHRRSSCPATTSRTRPTFALALLQGLLDTDGGPVTPARPHAAGSSTARPRRSSVMTSSSSSARWAACLLADPRRWRGGPLAYAKGRLVPYRHDAFVLDLRLPGRRRRRSGSPASATPTTRPAADGRCASSTASSRWARQDTICIQVGGRRLAVRDRRLPRHAQHA